MLQILTRFSALCSLIAVFLFSAQGHAQSLEEVLEQIGPPRSLEMTPEEYEQLKAFQREGDPVKMLQRLEAAREELAALEARETALLAETDQLSAQMEAAQAELMETASAFGEMLGQFRLSAVRVGKTLDHSIVSFEYPGRSRALRKIASARTLPTHADLMTLPKTILQEMTAQSEVRRFEAEVRFENENSQIKKTELIRIGVFTAATVDGIAFVGFRELRPETVKRYELVRYIDQPGEPYRTYIQELLDAQPGEVIRVPIDRLHGLTLQIIGKRSGRL